MSVRLNIKKLVLKENQFLEFPDLCLAAQQREEGTPADHQKAFYYLQSLDISGNPMGTIDPAVLRGRCLPDLQILDISSSGLRR